MRSATWPTEGQLKVMTMVYEDLFKGKSIQEGKMCCMRRVPKCRFERSLHVYTLRTIDYNGAGAISHPDEVRP